MSYEPHNVVGIDVSKGKSTIAVMRPFGEIVIPPFEVTHTSSDLKVLADTLMKLDGETRVVMEYTGKYYQPIARYLYESGLYVSVVHAKIIHDFANNSIRRIKTDKADAVKIANYGLSNWDVLPSYTKEDDTRLVLKTLNRQYNHLMNQYVVARNVLISIADQTCPGLNEVFTNPRKADGRIKWAEVYRRFWHCEYITGFSRNKFISLYNNWCVKNGFRGSDEKASELYLLAKECVPTLPKTEYTKKIVEQAASELISLSDAMASVHREMLSIAKTLPEYPAVLSINGIGETLGPQLMAEIGDVRRFSKRSNITAFAGVDAPPFQSGKFDSKSRRISKRGSCELRKQLFQVVRIIVQLNLYDDPVYQFVMRKKAEGKPYYVYMVAGCNKLLRIYYARVKEYLAAENAI